jgi:hypothetical protein
MLIASRIIFGRSACGLQKNRTQVLICPADKIIKEMGANFLQKPFSLTQLKEKVSRALS